MSIEIDIVTGTVGRPYAEPLLARVWPREAVARLPWGPVVWAEPDLRVFVETPDGVLSHVGIHFRTVLWKGRKHPIAGLGSLATDPDHRRRGYASVAVDAALRTIRDREAIDFVLLFSEPHNFSFYEARGWHRFEGPIMAEQPGGRARFEAMTPFIHDIKNGPREGAIDLCGLPW